MTKYISVEYLYLSFFWLLIPYMSRLFCYSEQGAALSFQPHGTKINTRYIIFLWVHTPRHKNHKLLYLFLWLRIFAGSHVVATTHYVTVKFPYVGFMSAKSHSWLYWDLWGTKNQSKRQTIGQTFNSSIWRTRMWHYFIVQVLVFSCSWCVSFGLRRR